MDVHIPHVDFFIIISMHKGEAAVAKWFKKLPVGIVQSCQQGGKFGNGSLPQIDVCT